MYRRSIAIVTASLLVAVGCGGDDEQSGSATTAGTEAPAASSAASAAGDKLEGLELTIYSGRGEELVQSVYDDFSKRTGVKVEVRYGSSSEMGAALAEEGGKTPADVFYSQEVGAVGVLAKAGLLSALPDELVAEVDPRFRPPKGNLWVGVTGRSRVIAYSKKLVPNPPQSTEELTKPEWKGKVAIVPGNAGFQAFITAFRVTKGDAAAKAWLEAMKANGVRTDITSNDDLVVAINNGEVPVGLLNHYYLTELTTELGATTVDTALVFPKGDDPGGLFNATAVGITKGGADNPAALAFVEYLLSPEGQAFFVNKTGEYPVIEGVADPKGYPARAELQGPALDLTDLDSLEATQKMLADLGLLT